jgi:hypothetical protein
VRKRPLNNAFSWMMIIQISNYYNDAQSCKGMTEILTFYKLMSS